MCVCVCVCVCVCAACSQTSKPARWNQFITWKQASGVIISALLVVIWIFFFFLLFSGPVLQLYYRHRAARLTCLYFNRRRHITLWLFTCRQQPLSKGCVSTGYSVCELKRSPLWFGVWKCRAKICQREPGPHKLKSLISANVVKDTRKYPPLFPSSRHTHTHTHTFLFFFSPSLSFSLSHTHWYTHSHTQRHITSVVILSTPSGCPVVSQTRQFHALLMRITPSGVRLAARGDPAWCLQIKVLTCRSLLKQTCTRSSHQAVSVRLCSAPPRLSWIVFFFWGGVRSTKSAVFARW